MGRFTHRFKINKSVAEGRTVGPIGANHGFHQLRSTMNAAFAAKRGQAASNFFRFVIRQRFHYVNRRFDRISLTIDVMYFCDKIRFSDWSAVPSEIKSNTLRRIGRFHG
jgi:hypothetical protein